MSTDIYAIMFHTGGIGKSGFKYLNRFSPTNVKSWCTDSVFRTLCFFFFSWCVWPDIRRWPLHLQTNFFINDLIFSGIIGLLDMVTLNEMVKIDLVVHKGCCKTITSLIHNYMQFICDQTAIICNQTIIIRNKTILICNQTIRICNQTILICDQTVIRCNQTRMKCNQIIIIYNHAIIICNQILIICNQTIIICNQTRMKYNQIIIIYNQTIIKCNQITIKCNQTILICN